MPAYADNSGSQQGFKDSDGGQAREVVWYLCGACDEQIITSLNVQSKLLLFRVTETTLSRLL